MLVESNISVVSVGSTKSVKSDEISLSAVEEVGEIKIVVDSKVVIVVEADCCSSTDENMSSPDPKSASGVSDGSSSTSLSSSFFTRYAMLFVGSIESKN